MRRAIIISCLLLVGVGAFLVRRIPSTPQTPSPSPIGSEPSVKDFYSCIAAGNPVQESFPRQCRAGNQMFVEKTTTPTNTPSSLIDDQIRVSSPQAGSKITSSVTIVGEARGGWFFEAQFPIRILDEKGQVIGQGVAKTTGEWMTENFVPFTATITFAPKEKSGSATIILEKDNPSGLPENAASLKIPVNY